MKRYLVGGAARDLLLGRWPKEWDYAFEGNAESFIQANPGACKVGRSVSVVLFQGMEYMPLASGTLTEDLRSRDLTINALALDENGRLHAHPLALDDLRARVLRIAAPDALERDPLRVFRIARFAAQFPDFSVHPATFAAMREAAANNLLASLPAERVGRETLRALAAPLPSRFLLVLADAGCLHPWFAECTDMDAVPAGPPQFHAGTVLEHTCRVMDALAGDQLTVWMGLVHDLGKTTTPPATLPHHYGHERRGKFMAHALAAECCLPVWGGVLADSQCHGRGQLRRKWSSPPGNIYAALRLPLTQAFASGAAALVTGTLLAEAFAQQGIALSLKWPNDLLLCPSSASGTPQACPIGKVGGILLEERAGALIAGIGINVASVPAAGHIRAGGLSAARLNDLPHVNIQDKDALLDMWSCLVDSFISCYRQWEKLGHTAWLASAEQRLVWKGEQVMLDDGERRFGVLLGLAASGGVRLVCDGVEKEFVSGNLSLVHCRACSKGCLPYENI
jgi:tRNA nucleotidyltransferase (CCA-adding enzyme)